DDAPARRDVVDHHAGDRRLERPGRRVEAERRAHAHVELASEVARHEDAGAGAYRVERRPRIARREAEVRRALGREGARVERVDADARAPEGVLGEPHALDAGHARHGAQAVADGDRKSTRLNSSHVAISYAV